MTEHPAISTLTLQHRIPHGGAADPWAEVRPLVDGVDLLREAHPEGLAPSCRDWTGPAESWPLAVTEVPRRVMITEPECTAGCCGALYVTMRREGDRVVWDGWENTSDITAPRPPDLRFDTAQYEAELHRAAADRSWEEPVDTIARLLGRTLADSGWFERWDCVLTGVWPRREEPGLPEVLRSPEGVDVTFHQVPEPTGRTTHYGYELEFTRGLSVEEQVRRLADHVLADDPRKTADVH
ncbi:hypothetical protein [Streptomyces sp. NPDC005374]|uniref:hypothetical protein n=1 Tax=Streptomyces sp. NPDC005374 TaxID=3364713 RepID=UPI00367A1DC2